MIFTVTYLVWLLSEIFLNRFLHSKSTDRKGTDRNSLSLIWLTIIVAIAAAVLVTVKFSFPLLDDPVIKYVGLGIIWIGIILRFWAIVSLGKFFTVDVTIREGHRLKKDGLYKHLRHPSYFASLLSFIGFGIALNNWLSLLIISVSILIVFIVRIKVEETVLIEQFGTEYVEYKESTKALIPFIY